MSGVINIRKQFKQLPAFVICHFSACILSTRIKAICNEINVISDSEIKIEVILKDHQMMKYFFFKKYIVNHTIFKMD